MLQPGSGLPVDSLARRIIAHEGARFSEELEIEAQLIAEDRLSSVVRSEHVIEALQRIGRKPRPDWAGRALVLLGSGGFGWAGEGIIESYLDNNADKMAAYVLLGVVSSILGLVGLLKQRL